jgi:hypothetical protein
VRSAKDFAWFLVAGIVGMLGALWAALSSFARKSSAEKATEKLDKAVEAHDAGAALRAKVAEAVASGRRRCCSRRRRRGLTRSPAGATRTAR